MADARLVLRLGLTPVLLLGWNMAAGDPLPFLAPSLVVTILAASPVRPKLAKLAGALAFVVGLTWVIAQLFVGLADTAVVVWLVLFAIAAAAFGRLARQPGDMLGMLTLITASVVVVIRQWAASLGLAVPWVIGVAMAQAIVAALIAFAVLPSPLARPDAAKTAPAGGRSDVLQAFGRSAGLIALLALAVQIQDNSAILVALTAVNILAASAEIAAQTQGRVLLVANAAAAAAALPLLAVATVQPNQAVLLLLAMAGGLLMARGAGYAGLPGIIAKAGLPVFVVLLGLLLPKAGDAALSALLDRLLTLGLVVLYALAVVALLRPAGRGIRRIA